MIQIKFRNIVVAFLLAASFALGGYIKTFFVPQVAVVNLERVLAQSQKLQKVRKEYEGKLNELSQWVDKINKEIEEEKDKNRRNKLALQYKNLTQEKENFIKQEYSKNLQEIDYEITVLIRDIALKNGYKVVLASTSVVSGGKDITVAVIEQMTSER